MGSNQGSSGHSQRLRAILRTAREDQGLSAREVADKIAAHLQGLGDLEATPPSVNTIYAWEKFERHPSISNFAAWSRVLGYRLLVDLDAADSARTPVLVRTDEAAEAARRIDLMSEADRQIVISMVRRIPVAGGR